MSWLPIENAGLRAVAGFCTIVDRLRPRSGRSADSLAPTIWVPSKRMLPAAVAPAGSSPRVARPTVVFPDPDSPTTPMTSDAPRLKLTSLTESRSDPA